MGLSAVVFLRVPNVPQEKLHIVIVRDSETGEWDSTNPPGLTFNERVAVMERIGNVDSVGELRDELEQLGLKESELSRIVASGSESGAVIPLESNPRLLEEIDRVQASQRASVTLLAFLQQVKRLVSASTMENNPICLI